MPIIRIPWLAIVLDDMLDDALDTLQATIRIMERETTDVNTGAGNWGHVLSSRIAIKTHLKTVKILKGIIA